MQFKVCWMCKLIVHHHMFAARGRRPVHGTVLVALFLLCYLLCIPEDKFKFAMFRLNWHETSVGQCERRGGAGGGMSSPNALPQVKTQGSSQLLGDLLHLCTLPPPPFYKGCWIHFSRICHSLLLNVTCWVSSSN